MLVAKRDEFENAHRHVSRQRELSESPRFVNRTSSLMDFAEANSLRRAVW
jgi:hypothetical protein